MKHLIGGISLLLLLFCSSAVTAKEELICRHDLYVGNGVAWWSPGTNQDQQECLEGLDLVCGKDWGKRSSSKASKGTKGTYLSMRHLCHVHVVLHNISVAT